MIPYPWSNLSIESDGTAQGTIVRVGEVKLEGVTSVAWKIVGPDQLPEVTLTMYAGTLSVVIPIEAAPS